MPHTFPPGLERNILWYALGRFRGVNPIELFQYLAATYGDAVHYKLGPKHIVFINHPDLIREVLVVQNDNFVKERTVRRSKLVLGEGMITAEGDEHRAQRRVAAPAFRRERIPDYAPVMVRHAARLRDRWRDRDTVDVSQEMLKLTMAIVGEALFGVDLGAEVEEMNDAVSDIMQLYDFLVMLPAAELYINWPLPQLVRFRRARARLDRAVLRVIAQRRASSAAQAPTPSSRADPRPLANVELPADLLSLMLRAHQLGSSDHPLSQSPDHPIRADSRLRDEVITILLAGYETVANALAWTFYLLSQNPGAEQRLHDELATVLGDRLPTLEDLPGLRYTEMVVAESMRLYPPAWAQGRIALRDFSLGPYHLPAGTTVLMSQFLIHRDPRWFPDPLRFDPDRFAAGADARRPRFSYFPFGGGPRQCIGESFAWSEAILVLATLAQRWRARLAPNARIEVWPLITLRPKHGIPVILERR